jgi:hypothetical protein
VVVTIDSGRRNDAPDGVGVVDEVLTERFARLEINFFRQMPNLGPPE